MKTRNYSNRFGLKRRGFFALGVALACIVQAAFAASPDQVAGEMQARVAKSLEEYNRTVARIAEEKAPLVRKVGELENANIGYRSQLNEYKRISTEGKDEIDRLSADLQELEAQSDYIHRILEEYLLKFESRIQLAEDQKFKAQLTEIRTSIDEGGSNIEEILGLYTRAIDLGMARQEEIIGGYSFPGRAINQEGDLLEGDIAVFGPTAYFNSSGSDVSGMLRFHSGTIEPQVVAFSGSQASDLSGLITSKEGLVPLDSSLGNALSLDDADLSTLDHIKQGGVVGYFILALGGVALLLSLIKLGDLNRFALTSPSDLQEVTDTASSEGVEQGLAKASEIPGVVGEMIQMGVRNISANAVLLEEMMLSVILKNRPDMERFLPFLAITAASAPLLGLLGTVVGMIKTFALITVFGTGDPKALSSGISEALVTTELGLIVAIPTLVLHGLFTRMVKSRVGMMEQIAFDFVKMASSKNENQ